MSKWLAGQSSILPGFLAIGAGQEAASVNQKTVTEMVDEFFRKDLATSPQVLSDGTRYRAVFGAAEIAGDIEEVMLFSADAVVVILDARDAITGWSTGAGQTLSVETSDRMQGTGSLESASSGAGPADLTFKKTTLSADISLADTALQVWFYVDDKTKLSGNIAIQLSSSITTGQHQWAWTVAVSGLVRWGPRTGPGRDQNNEAPCCFSPPLWQALVSPSPPSRGEVTETARLLHLG